MKPNPNLYSLKIFAAKGASLFLLVLLVSFSLPLGKSIPVAVDSERSLPFWFINFNDNRLVFKPTSHNQNSLSNHIDHSKNGGEPLRILHIGDSHIQADMFTGETRRLLAQWLGDENPSRGLTFPYQLAETNNPFDFEVSSSVKWQRERVVDVKQKTNLGVSGIAVVASEKEGSLSVKLNPKWSSGRDFNLVKLYFNEASKVHFSCEAESVVDIRKGVWNCYLNEPVDSLTLRFQVGSKKTNLRLYGIELLSTSSKVVYHAAGVNGAEVRTYLLSENIEWQIAQLNPHMVIVSLGTNDAYNPAFNSKVFRENLTELVSRIRAASADAFIILTTPGDHLVSRTSENPALERIQEDIYAVASESSCGVWDFYRVMGGKGSIQLWRHYGLCAPDMLHLNRNGYRLQGALLFNALVDFWDSEYQNLRNNIAQK
ncbi:MAG TPA: GDSL-type esterase/lipase family protein [Tenuifilaceae bacterium]|nr:GDSL-type esterase/lipase family protein [Tenuifilaceae bacterium]